MLATACKATGVGLPKSSHYATIGYKYGSQIHIKDVMLEIPITLANNLSFLRSHYSFGVGMFILCHFILGVITCFPISIGAHTVCPQSLKETLDLDFMLK